LQKFGELSAPHGEALAALGGRRAWPSASSVSRLLGALPAEQSEAFSQWLLIEALPRGGVAQQEAAQAYDRFGDGWHLLDWDATSTVLRQRALPAAEELPEPKRRAATLAEPGHPGRKRGEVQLGRATLQHSGTSQWLGLWCMKGNAPRGEQTRQAIAAMSRYCERHDIEPGRALLRCDGQAAGGMRMLLACEQAAGAYLTRISRYEVLDWPEVEQHLEQARFEPVQDSLSGPQREAAEVGSLRLVAHDKLPQESEKPVLRSRIVLSRFRASEPKRGVGVVRGPWQYETFATNLPPERFCAAETVAAYYGRCAQENRFLQEDRQMGLDRIFSYHLPGQHVACAIGLFCWNVRLALGACLHGLRPDSAQSIEVQAERVLPPRPSPLPLAAEPLHSEPPRPSPLPPAAEPLHSEPPSPLPPAAEPTNAEADKLPQSRPADWLEPLDSAAWSEALDPYPGWHWDLRRGGLLCPKAVALRLDRLKPDLKRKSLRLHFRAPFSACSLCPLRSGCTESLAPKFQKELTLRFHASRLPNIDLQSLAQSLGSSPPAASAPAPCPAPSLAPPEPAWMPPPSQASAGPLPARWPLLLPTVLSHAFAQLCLTVQIVISVFLPQPQPPLPPYIASGPAQRQRRRHTWQQRLERNRLPSATTVRIELHGAAPQLALLELSPNHSPPLIPNP